MSSKRNSSKHIKYKVFLQYPWKFSDSAYYQYLTEHHPKNIEYVNIERKPSIITSQKKFLFFNLSKKIIREGFSRSHISIPNARLIVTNKEYDLIHCAHCLSLNKRPWVVDVEGVWQFWVGKPNLISLNIIKKILKSKYCKKIMPWTCATKDEILKYFPDREIKEKLEVVYPAVPLPKTKRKKKRNKITILYVARYFWIKGGLVALETLRRLKKKYDILEYFISDVPKEVRKDYSDINIVGLVSQKRLFTYYYPNSDIFLYPSFIDTFGFSILEAMSFGLPVVTVNTPKTKSRKEIIKDGKHGFMINLERVPKSKTIRRYEEQLIKRLVDKISSLIEDDNLRELMVKNCTKLIKDGKFSIKERNKKLYKNYEEAMN